ncbi:hypothetical protein ACFO1B_17610 [Dactylosporangium siamense]|uniref:Uncharacterized protein n=1 Tax=Dactylosporangium siamense TaxID=685454 RepID=A0A919PIZ0_9ACTN|nr:hypothetical protein [Dactylosporangium siamense]GIG45661.1 hypothetical protein Dsi01nite_037020 [Dactylosporangium siamense]
MSDPMPTAVTVIVTDPVTVLGMVALLDGPALQRFGVTVDAAVITVVGTRLMRCPATVEVVAPARGSG